MQVDFSNLDLIPQLLKEIELLKSAILPKYDLTKRADVKKYLNISDSTITRYINDGTFQNGIHYTKVIKSNKVRIVFVESAILNFNKDKK